MRRTGTNKEVAAEFARRAYAHEEGGYFGNGKGTLYCRGNAVYSYGSHHVIARFTPKGLVQVNTRKYSNTTSRQTGLVCSALGRIGMTYSGFDFHIYVSPRPPITPPHPLTEAPRLTSLMPGGRGAEL